MCHLPSNFILWFMLSQLLFFQKYGILGFSSFGKNTNLNKTGNNFSRKYPLSMLINCSWISCFLSINATLLGRVRIPFFPKSWFDKIFWICSGTFAFFKFLFIFSYKCHVHKIWVDSGNADRSAFRSACSSSEPNIILSIGNKWLSDILTE